MIAKVSTGRSFGGAVRYLHEGHKNEQVQKRAQLLDYNGIRPGMEEMIKDFNRHRWLNPDLGNAVGHISLSYHQQDTAKLSDVKMIQHARDLMNRLGMNPEETQFALIRHNDRDHPHCHLVYNRIDYNGCTISDQFSRSRAKEAATIIARQEGFTVAADKKKDLALTHKANLPGHDQARYQIYEAIQKELPQATSIDELRSALKTHQIETILQKGGTGMSFKIGTHVLKASAVDRAYSGGKLHQAVDHNREERIEQETVKVATLDAFNELGDFLKNREQIQGFSQLADFIKKREAGKESEKSQEPDVKQTPKKDQSQGPKL
jgi:hypothetical protein